MIEANLAPLGQRVFFRGLDQRDCVVIGSVPEKHHTAFVPVGEFKAHDLRPKFRAPLDVGYAQHHVADFSNLDGSLFFCHTFLDEIKLLASRFATAAY